MAIRESSSLRRRVLGFVLVLIALSVVGSSMSLLRIAQVSRLLDGVNQISIPLGKNINQIHTDAEVFWRELDRAMGYTHWKDSHWRPRPLPRWIEEILDDEIERTQKLLLPLARSSARTNSQWASEETEARWRKWIVELDENIRAVKADSKALYAALEKNDTDLASSIYPRWNANIEETKRRIQWALSEYDRSLRQAFSLAEVRVSELHTGLEIVLVVVISLSLLILWFGERALRPLAELTRLARSIRERGLKKNDKSLIPEMSITRSDEVSQLASEFRKMATTLLEREKTVESQKTQLQEQNRLLRKMGELNESILRNITSSLIVCDLQGRVTHCNPRALEWLGSSEIVGKHLKDSPQFSALWNDRLEHWFANLNEVMKVELRWDERIYSVHLSPLRANVAAGAILVLEDLTDDIQLRQRLSHAENLAAVGRMSAQVAHEIRNPLHSIGLEAELAIETAQNLNSVNQISLKQSLQSILESVDRLENITQNYLKLSRLSIGEKTIFDIGHVVESVLATYANTLETQKIQVEWKRHRISSDVPQDLNVYGDRSLIEQAVGNLLRNAIQALTEAATPAPEIHLSMGSGESGKIWLSILDNGPGVAETMISRLFMPFATSRSHGTGLGLSFVKKVIEDHGGNIHYEFMGGACFRVFFPCIAKAETNQSERNATCLESSL